MVECFGRVATSPALKALIEGQTTSRASSRSARVGEALAQTNQVVVGVWGQLHPLGGSRGHCRAEASGCSRKAQDLCDCAHASWRVARPRTVAVCARQLQCKRPSRRDSRGFGALRGRLLVPSRPFFLQQLVTHHTHGWARHGWLGTGCSSPFQHRAPTRQMWCWCRALARIE